MSEINNDNDHSMEDQDSSLVAKYFSFGPERLVFLSTGATDDVVRSIRKQHALMYRITEKQQWKLAYFLAKEFRELFVAECSRFEVI